MDELMKAIFVDSLIRMRPIPIDEVDGVHPSTVCIGENCCIHNPSDHPLKDAPMFLRMDRSPLVERHCVHGIGHPDPDSLAYIERKWPNRTAEGVHGCDGCCFRKAKPKNEGPTDTEKKMAEIVGRFAWDDEVEDLEDILNELLWVFWKDERHATKMLKKGEVS